jgi:hypothetical protein
MKHFVDNKFCKSLKEVEEAIGEFQAQLSPEKCQNYITKLQEVVKIVIEKEGGSSIMCVLK